MRILVVVAHPDPNSFNHALAGAAMAALAANGHEMICHDLHQEGFDPLLPLEEIRKDARLSALVQRHCDDLIAAEGIVVVHPNWWGQPPAIMKGWIDRVFRAGVAYRFDEGDNGEGIPVGLLTARAALVLNTANTPERRELEVFGDPLETLWKNCIFGLCGVTGFQRRMYRVVCTSTLEQRREWLRDVASLTAQVFPAEGAAAA